MYNCTCILMFNCYQIKWNPRTVFYIVCTCIDLRNSGIKLPVIKYLTCINDTIQHFLQNI